MQAHYEINVALNGKHLFATAPRSAADKSNAKTLYEVLSTKFPQIEGYCVSITYWKVEGRTVEL